MGIPGRVFCGGADCSQDADGKLTGGWFFRPDAQAQLYVANPAMKGSYMVATMYARYGYWLTYDGDGDVEGVATHAATGHADTNTADLNLAGEGDPVADVTASYTGKAAGISVRDKTSGHFTANVNLTATFGTAPMLGGTISGFDGKAANSDWNVMLANSAIADNGSASGSAYGGTAAGAWTAQGYGPAPVDHDDDPNTDEQDQRPRGLLRSVQRQLLGRCGSRGLRDPEGRVVRQEYPTPVPGRAASRRPSFLGKPVFGT